MDAKKNARQNGFTENRNEQNVPSNGRMELKHHSMNEIG